MGRSTGQAEKVSVSLYPLDVALVEHVQAQRFMPTFSEALRYVLREYAQFAGVRLEEVMQLALPGEEG